METVEETERRMVVRQLDAWRHAREHEGHLPLKESLEQDYVEISPSTFVLEITDDRDEPVFLSIGADLADVQSLQLIRRPVSAADPQTLIGRAVQPLDEVLSKKVPVTTSGEIQDPSGATIHYRCILLPLSAASDSISFILGAVSFKTQ